MTAKGFVGAIKKHRMALEALRKCYRDADRRLRRLEAFRAAAEPVLVDIVAGRIPDVPAPKNPRNR